MDKHYMSTGKKILTRREFLIGGGAVLAAAALVACTPKATTITTTPETTSTTPTTSALIPKKGGVLKVANPPITYNLWPVDIMGQAQGLTQCCLETLLRADNKGNIYPWLAESYKVADDLKSITFTLRKGVKFHDGSDFNADVAKWSLDNYINAKSEAHWDSADIIDNYTVRVNFTDWVNTLPASFADGSIQVYMLSKASFDKNGLDWMRENPVGTGPFKFESFSPDVNFKVVRNPDYWVKGKPYMDGIEYTFIDDPNTRELALKSGEVDVSTISLKSVSDFKALGFRTDVVSRSNNCLVPDTASADSPWANQKVREAVEYAIDREAIAKAFGFGYWQAPYQLPSSSSLAYNPDFTLGRKHDPEKAKQLLAEAGYGDGFKTTIIQWATSSVAVDVLASIQASLAEVGIEVTPENDQAAKWGSYMVSGIWTKNALIMALGDLDVYYIAGLQFMFSMIGKSWLRTPEMTQAYQAALVSPAPDVKLVRAITDMITQNASIIPLYNSTTNSAQRSYVMTNFYERGGQAGMMWNIEDAWLNK